MTESFMKQYGARLVDNGYRILPIMPGTKKPGRYAPGGGWVDYAGWRQFANTPVTPYHVDLWETWPECGIGILCGEVVAIDIDILDHDLAIRIAAAITDILGDTPAVRIGKRPKMLLVYRTVTPFKKIQMHPIECLVDGQQFVAYATHPDTGMPYDWPIDKLADTPFDRLPIVTEAQVRKAMEAAFAMIPEDMRPKRALSIVADNSEPHVSSDLEGTPEAVEAILAQLPNDGGMDWDYWNRVGMAAFKASRGRCFAAFDNWSKKNIGYDPAETHKLWKGYKLNRITSIGFGTLQFLLEQSGAGPIDPGIPFNDAKRDTDDLDISALLASAPPPPEPKKPTATPEDRVLPSDALMRSFPQEWIETQSLVGDITRWILGSALHPHPTLALANTLGLMGALTGRRYVTQSEFLKPTRTNLYAVGIAPTASGKEHSRGCISALLAACGIQNTFQGGDDFTSEKAIVRMLQKNPSKLCQVDELGMVVKSATHRNNSAKQTVIPALLKLFSASHYLGQEYADDRIAPRIDLAMPNFNIYATTTPRTLVSVMSSEMVDSGLLNRMLFFTVLGGRQKVKLEKRVQAIPPSIVERVRYLMSARPPGAGNMMDVPIHDLAPEMIPVRFENLDVEQSVIDIINYQNELIDQNRPMWGRFAEYAVKLAMIEAIGRDPHAPVVTQAILDMGCRLAFWCFSYAEGLIEREVSDTEIEARVKQILEFINAGGRKGITGNELAIKFKGMDLRHRRDAVETLQQMGRISVEKQQTGGAPRFIYRVAG